MGKQSGLVLLAASIAALFVACGDETGSSSNSEREKLKIVPIENKTVAGVSQKGPLVKGASLTIQELDGETLAQTGRSFKGKISSDRGEFSVHGVSLQSQYALIEASGYYLNEVTGRKSDGLIALDALVDLSDRENANVNLLTHLEYERALNLASTGLNVPAAKKHADREIFEAFGLSGQSADAEDLDILSQSEGDAALLAISVLMQGNLSAADLSERLADFVEDIAADGVWNDSAAQVEMADWASGTDLSSVRAVVDGWSAPGKAPAFEQAVRAFVWKVYGLGTCAEDAEGKTARNSNPLSRGYGDIYVCRSGVWIGVNDGWNWDVPKEARLSPDFAYGEFVDARDGKRYRTTEIGGATWMAENLDYADSAETPSLLGRSWCFDDDPANCTVGGRLYTWAAAMDSAVTGCGYGARCGLSGKVRGICPAGWHLPDSAEWRALAVSVAAETGSASGSNPFGNVGAALKSGNGWNAYGDRSSNGADANGFSALPVGNWHYRPGDSYDLAGDGPFYNAGKEAYFWSSTEYDAGSARYLSLHHKDMSGDWYHCLKYTDGFSVRCVKD